MRDLTSVDFFLFKSRKSYFNLWFRDDGLYYTMCLLSLGVAQMLLDNYLLPNTRSWCSIPERQITVFVVNYGISNTVVLQIP